MIRFPNAKINIGLFVTEKRPDNYHNLETIFYPIPAIKDALEIVPAKDNASTSLILDGKSISGDSKSNLVWKAWEIIKHNYPEKIHNIDIHLLKSIPMGAGLGGGSSDAAFFLKMANDYFGLSIPDSTLAQYAESIGSDCPFFIYNTPHYACQKGEDLTPITLDLSAYSIQVLYPKVHISTPLAFSRIQVAPAPYDLKRINELEITEWRNYIHNSFETSVFEAYPFMLQLKHQLYAQGAIYASLSGSGSAIYGIFNKGERATFDTSYEVEFFYNR